MIVKILFVALFFCSCAKDIGIHNQALIDNNKEMLEQDKKWKRAMIVHRKMHTPKHKKKSRKRISNFYI